MAGVKLLAPRTQTRIPVQETGWHILRYALLRDGSIARMDANFDAMTSIDEHRRRTRAGENLGPWSGPPAGARCRIVTMQGEKAAAGPEFPQRELFPHFDRMADDTWVIADARWRPGSRANGRLIGSDGRLIADILLDDGIEHLQCDGLGHIWVGYFDEGIHSGTKEHVALGRFGLNRFDASGASTMPPSCRDWSTWPLPLIADCYAMNVADDAVWLCTYADFPISRFGFDGDARVWTNDKSGARMLAVDGDLAVLLGGYRGERRHGALLRLEQDAARQLGEFTIDMDIDDLRRLPLAQARGSTLNFVTDETWSCLTVADIAEALL